MHTDNEQELYTSPTVKVMEIKTRRVICESSSTDGQLGSSNWETGSWE